MSESVRKAFRIIRHIADRPQPQSLTAVSRGLGIDKSTAYRYLETFAELGVVDKSEGGYRLGLALFELGNRVPVFRLLVERFDPFMRRLCDEVNETVNLAQWHRQRAVYLHKIESRRSLQMRADIGGELPLHCTALGKAILSSLPGEQGQKQLQRITLKPHTDRTLRSRASLRREVEAVRRRGYATDIEEFEVGLTCVAVPLTLPEHDFFGALSVSAPSIRMSQADAARIGERLRRTAAAIGEGAGKE